MNGWEAFSCGQERRGVSFWYGSSFKSFLWQVCFSFCQSFLWPPLTRPSEPALLRFPRGPVCSLNCSWCTSFHLNLREMSGRNAGLEFIDLECHNSINSASGNANTARHVSVRRPTPPVCPHLKIRGRGSYPLHCFLNHIQYCGSALSWRQVGYQCRLFWHPSDL